MQDNRFSALKKKMGVEDEQVSMPEEISPLETAARTAGSSLAFGQDARIAGALGAAKDVMTGDGKLSDIVGLYRDNKEDYEDRTEDAIEQNPKSALAGEVVGTAASLALPGGLLGRLGKGGKAAYGAIQGGLQAASESEADEDLALPVAGGAALGAAKTMFPTLSSVMKAASGVKKDKPADADLPGFLQSRPKRQEATRLGDARDPNKYSRIDMEKEGQKMAEEAKPMERQLAALIASHKRRWGREPTEQEKKILEARAFGKDIIIE